MVGMGVVESHLTNQHSLWLPSDVHPERQQRMSQIFDSQLPMLGTQMEFQASWLHPAPALAVAGVQGVNQCLEGPHSLLSLSH